MSKMQKGRDYYQIKTSRLGYKRKVAFSENLINDYFTSLYPTCNILEIGSGFGFFAGECKKGDFRYIGVEVSDELIKSIQSRGIMSLSAKFFLFHLEMTHLILYLPISC